MAVGGVGRWLVCAAFIAAGCCSSEPELEVTAGLAGKASGTEEGDQVV